MDFLIRRANENDLDGIMKIMREAENNPVHPDWFVSDDEASVRRQLEAQGFIMVAETEDQKIAGFFMIKYPDEEENMGKYLSFSKKQLEQVAHMESAVVSADYRGNRLQERMLHAAEEHLDKSKWKYLMSTVHPENRFSLSNMQRNGYEIQMTVQCYGGLTRHVLMKKL